MPDHAEVDDHVVDHAGQPLARRFDERGAGLVEYALLVALIVLTCVGAMTAFSNATEEKFTTSCEAIGGAMTGNADCS